MKHKPLIQVEKRRAYINTWKIGFWVFLVLEIYAAYFMAIRWQAMINYMRMGYTKAVYNILIGGDPNQGKPVNGDWNANRYNPQ